MTFADSRRMIETASSGHACPVFATNCQPRKGQKSAKGKFLCLLCLFVASSFCLTLRRRGLINHDVRRLSTNDRYSFFRPRVSCLRDELSATKRPKKRKRKVSVPFVPFCGFIVLSNLAPSRTDQS